MKVLGRKGGGSKDGKGVDKGVNFIDYDGTILYSYTPDEIASLKTLPRNPSHKGLTAQGWNWSLDDILVYLAKYPDALSGEVSGRVHDRRADVYHGRWQDTDGL